MLEKKSDLSIITIVFNDYEGIESTIKSVIDQKYRGLEYIVVDGGSTDGTMDIVSKYQDFIDLVISEPDDGIYDAMNKGIKASTGRFVGLINSGDKLADHSVEYVLNYFALNPNSQVLCGAIEKINGSESFKLNMTRSRFVKSVQYTMPCNHPAAFVKRDVYDTYGVFDCSYKICGDYELMYRFYNRGVRFGFTNTVLAKMLAGGISEKLQSVPVRAVEHYIIRKRNMKFVRNIMLSLKLLLAQSSKIVVRNFAPSPIVDFYRFIKGQK